MLSETIRISATSEKMLRDIKNRTGVDKNVIARMAICKSIGEEFKHISPEITADGDRYPKTILLGNFADLYDLLLADLHSKDLNEDELSNELRNHLQNGLSSFRGVKKLSELVKRLNY